MSSDSASNHFHLRSVLQCHATDTRTVSSFGNDGFVTGSRDRTAKVYIHNPRAKKFVESQCFIGPEHFVGSVCCLKTEDETLIYVGSNDSVIYCYSLLQSEPKYKMTDHSGTVCALTGNDSSAMVLSGSWDHSARLWKDGKCISAFKGHDATVWATAFIADMIITGSADHSLKLWKYDGVECVKTFSGHTDCVRGIAILTDAEFVSCSNDATVRHWNINGESIGVYYGHDNYIYSISSFNDKEFVTCSEDKTARLWNRDKCVETIRLPATTLWSVSVLSNGDFVVAASNGKVYVYSRDESLKATEDEQKSLADELEKSTQEVKDIGDIKVNELPGIECLYAPGKKDGQTKMVRDGNSVSVHQWVADKGEWIKIGDVVGAAGATHDPSQKEVFEGKEYDYVFNIDIKDDAPPLKLPYNVSENPFMAAQEFIHKHDLSQLYLDQIANFIIKNSK